MQILKTLQKYKKIADRNLKTANSDKITKFGKRKKVTSYLTKIDTRAKVAQQEGQM